MELDEMLYYGGMFAMAAAVVFAVVMFLVIRYRRARLELRLNEIYGDTSDMAGRVNLKERRMPAAEPQQTGQVSSDRSGPGSQEGRISSDRPGVASQESRISSDYTQFASHVQQGSSDAALTGTTESTETTETTETSFLKEEDSK